MSPPLRDNPIHDTTPINATINPHANGSSDGSLIPSSKHGREEVMSLDVALTSISHSLNHLTSMLLESFKSEAAQRERRRLRRKACAQGYFLETKSDTERKVAAFNRIQELETDLSTDEMVSLLDIVGRNAAAADMYLDIQSDDLRKANVVLLLLIHRMYRTHMF